MNFTEKNEITDFFKVNANFGYISIKQLAYKDGAGRRFSSYDLIIGPQIKAFWGLRYATRVFASLRGDRS